MNYIVSYRESRTGCVDSVQQISSRLLVRTVTCDYIPVDEYAIAVPQDALIPVVMDVAIANDDVVGIVDLDAVPAVTDLKSFDSNPADGVLITFLGLKQYTVTVRLFAQFSRLNHGMLTGMILEYDRLSLLPGEAKHYMLSIYTPTHQNHIARARHVRSLLNRL
jgi:hypothetical protein